MSDSSDLHKIWTRFESKKADGSTVKLRIQGYPAEDQNEIYEFLMNYFVPSEAVHKAAGVSKNPEAVKEYREILSLAFQMTQTHVTVCCVDNESDTVEEILGVSVVQLMKSTDRLEDLIKDMVFKTEEIQKILYAAYVLDSYTEAKADYDIFYYGRGIIVHPDYRGMGIANELVKVRKLICIHNDIRMSCAWMSAVGTQKAAHKDNWKTMSEAPLEELEEKMGLTFEQRLPSFKFMYITAD